MTSLYSSSISLPPVGCGEESIPTGSLVQAYGVSRDTVRRTMALLRDEGVVFTVPHRGTYVGPRPQ